MADVRFEESIVIDADPVVVFDYRLDFSNLPDYNPNVSNLRRIDGGSAPGVGAEYVFELSLPGAPEPIESPLRITEVERPDRFRYDTGPGFMAKGDCVFETAEGGTRLILAYTLTIPGEVDDTVAKQLADMGRADARLELENIKIILES